MMNEVALKPHLKELSQEEQEYVLEECLKGTPLLRVWKKIGLNELYAWEYRKTYPLFEQKINEARRWACERLADSLLEAFNDAETVSDAMIAKGHSENIKSVIAFRNPQVYGNRIDLNVQHSIDLSSVLAAADSRVIPILEQKESISLERSNSLIPGSSPTIPTYQLSRDRASNGILGGQNKTVEVAKSLNAGKVDDASDTSDALGVDEAFETGTLEDLL